MPHSREDTTLDELRVQIFKKHGIEVESHSAAFYD